MGISFANVDLLLEDPSGDVAAWIDRWVSTADGRMIVDWDLPHKTESFPGTSAACYSGQTLPRLPYSRPTKIKLNTWYIPTGASRWSFGLFLCDYKRLNSFLSANGSTGGQLLLTDGINKRSWFAYLLPPHPVSATAFDPTSLWILPIVDERWYWQFFTSNVAPVINGTSRTNKDWQGWVSDVVANLSQFAGTGFSADTVSAAYLRPNYFFLSGPGSYGQSTYIIDLMLHSVGLRLVPNYAAISGNTNTFLGGSFKAINFASSTSQRLSNLSNPYDLGTLQAGSAPAFPGEQAITPATVTVVFRGWANGIILPDWYQTRYQKTIPASTFGEVAGNPNYDHQVLSMALADFTSGGPNPGNQSSLDQLASQVASDFYSSQWIQDSVRLGISQWQETGFDDYLEFTADALVDGERTCKTRIHSVPYNFSSDYGFHYDGTTWEFGDTITGTLDGNLASGGTQTITVQKTDGPMTSDTIHLTITALTGSTGNTGDQILAKRVGNLWVAIPTKTVSSSTGDIFSGTFSAVVTAGNTGTFTLAGGGTVTATVSEGICLPSVTYQAGKDAGGTYYILNPHIHFYGQFGSALSAGSSGTCTIFSGTLGSETTTGVTVTALARPAAVIASKTYLIAYTTGGYEVVDSLDVLRGRPATMTVVSSSSGASITTFNLYTGALGSETASGLTLSSVFMRKGICFTDTTYEVIQTDGGYMVKEPSLMMRGQPGADIAADAAGTMTIYTGTGSGTTTGVTSPSIRNDSSCVVKALKLARALWEDSLFGWVYAIWHSS